MMRTAPPSKNWPPRSTKKMGAGYGNTNDQSRGAVKKMLLAIDMNLP
jgi:hypothetical protein